MKQIQFLLNTVPAWASVKKTKTGEFKATARSLKPSGKFGDTFYDLTISGNNWGGVSVSETNPGAALPTCCVERHINPGGSFCLFLNSTRPLNDNEDADELWHTLGAFLFHQEYSQKRGIWPAGAAYSHGDAANQQIEMERLADSTGWKDEVLQGIFRHRGWLGGELPRLSKKGDRLVNARTPCPRGCRRLHPPMSKRSCDLNRRCNGALDSQIPMLRAECPHRGIIEQLVLLEYQRREAEEKFFLKLKQDGVECCGTMNSCQLSETT